MNWPSSSEGTLFPRSSPQREDKLEVRSLPRRSLNHSVCRVPFKGYRSVEAGRGGARLAAAPSTLARVAAVAGALLRRRPCPRGPSASPPPPFFPSCPNWRTFCVCEVRSASKARRWGRRRATAMSLPPTTGSLQVSSEKSSLLRVRPPPPSPFPSPSRCHPEGVHLVSCGVFLREVGKGVEGGPRGNHSLAVSAPSFLNKKLSVRRGGLSVCAGCQQGASPSSSFSWSSR